MSASDEAERSVYRAAREGLRRWLGRAREVVLAPWTRFQAQPSPDAIGSVIPEWRTEVDRIADALTPAIREGWVAASLPGDVDLQDPYIQANLAMTKNLLVRIPDEVHALVVREILEGVNAQESMGQIANRVQQVLTYTGSEDWDGRAKTISRTETNRHFNSSMLAHALLLERQGRRDLTKQWDTRMDTKERPWHHDANNQIRPLGQPFDVGGEPLLFPVDPRGRPDNVVNCVPPWTLVSVSATGFMVRRFSGMLCNITTTGGNKLSATANHPVFTRHQGWIPIGSLKPGDDLLCCTEAGTRAGSVNPHINYRDSSIEEVTRLVQLFTTDSKGVSSTFVDLDGNVVSKDVNVVRSDNVLQVGRHTKQLNELRHLSIHGCKCEMCFTCNNSPSFFLKESDQVGLMGSTDREPEISKDSDYPLSSDPKFYGHSLDRDSFLIHVKDFCTEFGMKPFGCFDRSAVVKSKLLQCLLNLPHAEVQRFRDFAGRQPKFTELAHAINIFDSIKVSGASWHTVSSTSDSYYDGVVYDLSTIDGLFSAEGIVVSNCRCSVRIIGGFS